MSGDAVAVDTAALRSCADTMWRAHRQLADAGTALATVRAAGRDEALGEAHRYASGAHADSAIRGFSDRWGREVELVRESMQHVITLVMEAADLFEQIDRQALGG